MFYLKEKIGDTAEVSIELNDGNIFCRCPGCGSEVRVALLGLVSTEDADLFVMFGYCDECSKKISFWGGQNHENQ